jgi:hypothetical protein
MSDVIVKIESNTDTELTISKTSAPRIEIVTVDLDGLNERRAQIITSLASHQAEFDKVKDAHDKALAQVDDLIAKCAASGVRSKRQVAAEAAAAAAEAELVAAAAEAARRPPRLPWW